MSDKTATAPGPAPDTIKYAYWALLVASAASVISPLILLTQRAWLEASTRKSDAKAKPPVNRTAKDLHDLATNTMRLQVILGVVVAVVLVWLAINLRKGSYRARWVLFGVYILLALGGYSLIGLFSILNVAGDVPGALKVSMFIGGVALLAAVVLSTLKPSSVYVNRNRPVRAAPAPRTGAGGAGAGTRPGGLLGQLFAPRPPAGGASKTGSASAGSGKSAPSASSGQPMRRGKAKARTADAPAAPAAPETNRKPKAKGR